MENRGYGVATGNAGIMPRPQPCLPDRLLLAMPKMQAVRQREQSNTSDQSHHPCHTYFPPAALWKCVRTRGRSGAGLRSKALLPCPTRKWQARDGMPALCSPSQPLPLPLPWQCPPRRVSQPPHEGPGQSLSTFYFKLQPRTCLLILV